MANVQRAELVSATGLGALETATVISRAEIERALRAKEQPELVLEVVSADRPDSAEVVAHTVRVAWDRGDLEKVLRENESEELAFRFGSEELEAALDADVEAHGLRERAAVLAVAVTAAGTLVGQAAARPLPVGGGTAPPAQGLTAKQIWAAAPATLRSSEARVEAARAKRLETPAPYHPTPSEPTASAFDISAPSPSDAALAGSAALVIVAAGFAARGRHQRPHRTA